jgi:putative phosphoesterase
MRVAVLSDIHGVLPALEAVLAEPDVHGAERIVLTGDLAAGPQPVGTLDALIALGERALWVRGNADRELVTTTDYPIDGWAADQLTPGHRARLAALPLTVRMPLGRLGETVFCHATPRSDHEIVLVDSPIERWHEVFADLPETVSTVVCGHTHMPFVRLADRRLVVNPGSVGMPYGGAGAHWALLDGDTGAVSLRRTVFDVDAACERIVAESGYPQARAFAAEYVRSQASDVDALRAFHSR